MSVVVIGGSNLDTIARTDTAPVAETSNPGRTTVRPGGVGRNIAENLARLGTDVTLISALGAGHAAQTLRESLAGAGLREVDSGHDTGSYTAVLNDNGGLVIGVADMAATDAITPDLLKSEWFGGASVVVLDGNLPIDTLARAMELAGDAAVMLDPVSVAKGCRLRDLAALPLHTFTPNHDELLAIAQTDSIEEACEWAHQRGVEYVWLREGAAGSLLSSTHGSARIPVAPARTVVDVTGAGDAALAAYVHRIMLGDSPQIAATFGAHAAKHTIEVAGAVAPLTRALLESEMEAQ
jgi:pseudouridine kinase